MLLTIINLPCLNLDLNGEGKFLSPLGSVGTLLAVPVHQSVSWCPQWNSRKTMPSCTNFLPCYAHMQPTSCLNAGSFN